MSSNSQAAPSPRSAAASVVLPSEKVFIFGGSHGSNVNAGYVGAFNDSYLLNVKEGSWERVELSQSALYYYDLPISIKICQLICFFNLFAQI